VFPKPTIEIQNQIVGQALAISGTPFSLHYTSDRVQGRRAAYSIRIPLSGKSVPRRLKRIELEVSVAGQRFAEGFSPAPEQSHTFIWDGKNSLGEIVPGKQPAKIRIGYTYRASFPRPEITRWRERVKAVGTWNAVAQGLGGWTLSVHHAYDCVGRVLYLGDGRRRSNLDFNAESTAERASTQANQQQVVDSGNRAPNEIILPAENSNQLYIFDATGRHVRTVNALTGGLLYRFVYDAAGHLTSIEDGDSNITLIGDNRDVSGKVITAPHGQRTTLSKDIDGYLASVTDPAGRITSLSYSAEGLLTSVTDPTGNVYSFKYDDKGLLVRSEDPTGGCSSLASTRDTNGSLVAAISALGREITYMTERRSGGQERRVISCCGGAKTEILHAPDGTRTITHPDGTTASLQEQPDPRWGSQSPLVKTARLATPGGRVATLSVDRQVTLADSRNPLSVQTLTDILTINGRKYTSVSNAIKRETTTTSPAGRKVSTRLDEHDRVVQIAIRGLIGTLRYDPHGRLTMLTLGTDEDARVFTIHYDPQGRISDLTDPLQRTSRFEYDESGLVTKEILADDRTICYTYDANRNRTSITLPGKPPHSFEYTPVNLLRAYLPPRSDRPGGETTYIYNQESQLTSIKRPSGENIELSYDDFGHLHAVTCGGKQRIFGFDTKTNRLSNITDTDGALSYTYDTSFVTKTTWAGLIRGVVSRNYDADLRVISREVNGGPPVDVEYDLDGLLTRTGLLIVNRDSRGLIADTRLANLTTKREYNVFGEVTAFHAKTGKDVLSFQYERDPVGRITTLNEATGEETATFVYGYDLAGRLIDVARDGVEVAHYVYDSSGNRVAFRSQAGTLSGTYDAQDRLVQYGNVVYSYSPDGECISKTVNGETTGYDYDAFGNLTAVNLPEGTRIEYIVDGENRRIGRRINGNLIQGLLYQDGLKPIAELDSQNKVVSNFVYATGVNVPDYMVRERKTYRILTDHLGSPRLVIDIETGAITQRLDYDEFGSIVRDTNPGFQPFGFAGGLYDQLTKLTRFGARDYDAFTGRWTASDPLGFASDDTNLYGYVSGDPVNSIDPTGRAPGKWVRAIWELLKLIGGQESPPMEPGPPPPPPGPSAGPTGGAPAGSPPPEGEFPPGDFVPPPLECFPLIIIINEDLRKIMDPCNAPSGNPPIRCGVGPTA
jgi:RHS repeat-associated protein